MIYPLIYPQHLVDEGQYVSVHVMMCERCGDRSRILADQRVVIIMVCVGVMKITIVTLLQLTRQKSTGTKRHATTERTWRGARALHFGDGNFFVCLKRI